VCTIYETKTGQSEVLDFVSGSQSPMLARGIAALQARYGSRPWANAVAPAEAFARFGFPVSKMLAEDLSAHGGVLMADQTALAAFMDRRRQFAVAGTEIRLPQMAETLQKLRTQGAGAIAGTDAPSWRAATVVTQNDVAISGPALSEAPPNQNAMPGASTGFAVGDKNGLAVSCVLSMGTPFGTGRTEPEAGFFTARVATDLATARPVVIRDTLYGHVVFIAAAHGAAARQLVETSAGQWLVDGAAYDKVRAQVQAVSPDGTKGAIAAALCPTGLAVRGLDCRTFTDIKSYGLGLTFGPNARP